MDYHYIDFGGYHSQRQPRNKQPLRQSTVPLPPTKTPLSPPKKQLNHDEPTQTRSAPTTAIAGPSRQAAINTNGNHRSVSQDHMEPSRKGKQREERYQGDRGGVHPLQLEIDRLNALCQEHELKIRSSKATIEHRLFAEFPNMLSRLNETDEMAEQLTARLYTSLNTRLPPLQTQLQTTLKDREKDYDTMKERTTPWRRLRHRDNSTDESEATTGSRIQFGRRRSGTISIKRVDGVDDGGDVDGLGTLEKWAEEVTLFLDSEKIRIEEKIQSFHWRNSLLRRLILLFMTLISVIVLYSWARNGFSFGLILGGWRGVSWVRKRDKTIGEL